VSSADDTLVGSTPSLPEPAPATRDFVVVSLATSIAFAQDESSARSSSNSSMRPSPGSTSDPAAAAGDNTHAFRGKHALRLPAWAGDASLLPDDGDITVRYDAPVDGAEGAAGGRKPHLRILLSAYSMEPNARAERGVGWRWALDLAAAGHEVWVITSARNAGAIERALAAQRVTNLHFIYHDLPAWARMSNRWKRAVRAFSPLWTWGAHRVARGLCRRVAFDAGFEVKNSRVDVALRILELEGSQDKAPR
jgi:hypothetical protein